MTARLVSADSVITAKGRLGSGVLVEDDTVVAVGEAAHLRTAGIEELRHPGHVIVPGLVDTHIHPVAKAALDAGPQVHDVASITELVDRLRQAASDLPVASPVVAQRFDEHRLEEGRLPTRLDLDAVDRPTLVYRLCGHVAVANTAALDAAGIGPNPPTVVGGNIDIDDLGRPTGVLREEAIGLVSSAMEGGTGPGPEGLAEALRRFRSEGLTRLGAILAPESGLWCATGDELGAAVALGNDLPLPLHVHVATTDPVVLEASKASIESASTPKLDFAGLKLFSDGSFGGGTAAMSDGRGISRLRPERDLPLAQLALDLGGGVAIHAIGDAAASDTLDLFEALMDRGADPARLRIEHASTLTDDLIERIALLGVGVGAQPAFVASDQGWLDDALGEQARFAHRFGSLAAAGVAVGGGSDCPVEPASPLWGMRWARDRNGFHDTETVDGATALGWWTDGAHRLLGLPAPLTAGSPADLTILSADPTSTPAAQLSQLEVSTIIGGQP
mgnify:CR=1 FL=1